MKLQSHNNNTQKIDEGKSSFFPSSSTTQTSSSTLGMGCKEIEPTSGIKSQMDSTRVNGFSLPSTTNNSMSDTFGFNFNDVKIHTGEKAAQMNHSLNAKAFTYGSDIYFNKGNYNPNSSEGKHLLGHELTHVVQQNNNKKSIQRMELDKNNSPTLKKSDWYPGNRIANDKVWHNANLYNLKNGLKDEYTQIYQRRDFYLWFYNEIRRKGFEVKWPLAAYIVAGGAEKIANFDTIVGNERLEVLLRQGNQIIFDDVFPKLKSLFEGPVLKGKDAEAWDKKTLGEEQNLIQPLYKGISSSDLKDMEQIAKGQWRAPAVKIGSIFTSEGTINGGKYHKGGDIPFFPSEFSLIKPEHRFKYGMMLAEKFAKDGRGAKHGKKQTIPKVASDYTSGKALKAVKNKDNIHKLTSISTNNTRNYAEIARILGQLNPTEKRIFEEDPLYKRDFFKEAKLNRTQFEIVTKHLDKETTKKLMPYMCPNCHDEQRRDAARKSQPLYDFNSRFENYLETDPIFDFSPSKQKLTDEQRKAIIEWINEIP